MDVSNGIGRSLSKLAQRGINFGTLGILAPKHARNGGQPYLTGTLGVESRLSGSQMGSMLPKNQSRFNEDGFHIRGS
jgi:hypothetical protein